MSDMYLHHDLYQEASSRRSREADSWVRDQKNRRSARRAASRGAHRGVRVRLVALMARAMGVAGAIATTSAQPQQHTAALKHPH